MKQSLLVFVFLIFFGSLSAQNGQWVPGVVISKSGNTYNGYIRNTAERDLCTVALFKDKSGNKTSFYAQEINNFTLKNKQYESLTVKGKRRVIFFQVTKGKLAFYRRTVAIPAGNSKVKDFSKYYFREAGKMVRVPADTSKFKAFIGQRIKSYTELNRLVQDSVLTYNDVERIIKIYNGELKLPSSLKKKL
jgi:hypothetical protein